MLRDPFLPVAMRSATAAAAAIALLILAMALADRSVPSLEALQTTEGRVAAVDLDRSVTGSVKALRIRLEKGGTFVVGRPQSRFSVVRTALQRGTMVRIRHDGARVWQIDGVLDYEVVARSTRRNAGYGYQLAAVFALIAVLCSWYTRIISAS